MGEGGLVGFKPQCPGALRGAETTGVPFEPLKNNGYVGGLCFLGWQVQTNVSRFPYEY